MEEIKREEKNYGQFSDEELLDLAKEKDWEAFNQIHLRYRRKIMNFVYRMIGDIQVAEDVTQETFIRVYTHLDSYHKGNFAGWIYTIARNLSKNELKRKKKEREVSLESSVSGRENDDFSWTDVLSNQKDVQETDARQKELEDRVQQAINKLPFKYREVLILCGIQGLSYKEAAKILNCSVENVGVRMHRAREMMRKMFFGKRGR
ncbi:MAG: sigma-70 family RNA polymerase sigma factor [Candidatus Omnitrophica bacterium]|nr:sigma-70 family RNA polymerase sigma factor [Candidatus Omnitrophota bacterium]